MKILLDGRLYGLEHAGIGRYLIHLITELQKIDKKNDYYILLRKKYFNSLKLEKNWKLVLADFSIYGFKEQIKLPNIIQKIKPDITHFPHFNIPIVGHGKFVVTLHDMTMHKQNTLSSKLSPILYFLKNLIYRLVFKMAVRNSEKIIVPSKTVSDEIKDYYGLSKDKIKVIYEGFNKNVWNGEHKLDVLDANELAVGSYFIYVGSLYPHKNIKSLIDALYLLNKHSEKKAYLAVVGSKNLFLSKLEEYITQKKLENYVSILGFVKDEDISALMKNSIAFVYPSLSEGFGLQGLEAMSSETIVLSSDIPVFHEIYGDNSIYFDPFSPMDLAKKMEKTIKFEKKDRDAKIAKAKKFIQRYSWNKMAKETLKVYSGFEKTPSVSSGMNLPAGKAGRTRYVILKKNRYPDRKVVGGFHESLKV